tara:strand:+ start:27108 stop:27791 length:684 start_codon:yes stop_codon:yes gene_type:complete
MKPLIVIPARGGSKGIPGKNTKLLNGKPLINYTIDVARSIFDDERIIVSTDAESIKLVVESTGLFVPFLRPKELSTDTATSYDVLLHAMNFAKDSGVEFDTVILLQPTSPFRTSIHIKEALQLYSSDIDMVVSVKESDENPYYSLFEEDQNGFLEKSKEGQFTRRQDCPKVYSYNGAIYIINPESLHSTTLSEFKKIRKYSMPSINSIDLDTPLDWELAALVSKKMD